MRGVKELRVKESDRIDAMADGLRACGVTVEEGEDWWIVEGLARAVVPGGATCVSHLDPPHRHVVPRASGWRRRRAGSVDDAARSPRPSRSSSR
jgi:5-enolpyruvylshikimate-3-phosphate synthase